MISDLHFIRPEWLWCIAPAVLLSFLLAYSRRRKGSWRDIIAPELLPHLIATHKESGQRSLLPVILLAWCIAAIAVAGPAWNKLPQPLAQTQDALVIVLDLSYSMQAQDISPSRTTRAQQKLLDLLAERAEGQTGLVAYAGDAHIVTPLTDDNPTITNLIPALNPTMMPVLGSNPAPAIEMALELLHSAGVARGKILLLTDGVDPQSRAEITQILRAQSTTLAVMGVGTPTGAPIPLPQGGFLNDTQGNIVVPSLDEDALRALASDNGGSYARLSLDDRDLGHLLTRTAAIDEEQTLSLDPTADAWEDQGYLLILFLLPIALSLFRRGWVICIVPTLFLLSNPEPAMAQSWDDLWLTPDQQGRKALTENDNAGAAVLFENPDWAGTALYRDTNFEQAVEAFAKTETADSQFNLGNAHIQTGNLDEAIAAYKRSLEILPGQRDAQDNLALAEKLKQEQEQEQEQDNTQDNQNQDQDQQDSSQQQQSDSQPNENAQDQPSDQQPSEQQDQDEPLPDEGDDSSDETQDQQPQPGGDQEQETTPTGEVEASPEDKEREQAMQQWLRRVPDDPSGLLREKFRYESQQREQLGNGAENDTNW